MHAAERVTDDGDPVVAAFFVQLAQQVTPCCPDRLADGDVAWRRVQVPGGVPEVRGEEAAERRADEGQEGGDPHELG